MTKKIAVLRANALGDFIFCLPALQALRETFPDAEIVYLGKAWHKEYVNGRPGPVDRVEVILPYPSVGGAEDIHPDKEQMEDFFCRMSREEFDIAVQMHGGGYNSNPFLLKLGAKLTIGFKTPNAAPLDINIPYVACFSEILRYLELVSRLGAKTKQIEPVIRVTEQDLDEAYTVLKPVGNNHFAVVHPGATDLRRRWPAENFAAIADFLTEQGYRVCLTGAEFEQGLLENVLSHITHQSGIINLCGKISLSGLTGVLSLAGVMVSNDTGPLHLARALQIPTVGIYWAINGITGSSVTASLHRSLISWDPHCPLCGADCVKPDFPTDHCKHETSFTVGVSIEDAKQALQDNLRI